jgi:hypothetical protein
MTLYAYNGDEKKTKFVSESGGGRKVCICAQQHARASLKQILASMATNGKE